MVTKLKKSSALAILFILVVAIVVTSWWRKTERRSGCFEKTEIGQDYQNVVSCFGFPDQIHTKIKNDGYYLQNAQRDDKSVEKVIVYPFFFDVNIATISFGKDDKVVGKYLYSSP